MTDLVRLEGAANKTELAASRKRARQTGIPYEAALRATLETSAGALGLPHLLAERAALRAAEAARALARRAARDAALALRRARHEGAPTAWRAWFDGSAKPNPGRCGIGARLLGPDGELVELSQPAGWGNSSEAEYRALILVLETALAQGAGPLTVYGDSRVVVDDVNGSVEDSALVLRPLRARAHALLAQLPAVTLRWVPRHKNLEADALSQRARASLAEEPDDSTTY
ncbi:ribonuclease HI family protein [Massilia sp.]|uniref:ribonuclease HI family protein n=1 Tax=Massilia sp. TaxID=1882437 RepID=UPI0028A9D7AB|nr:ribonuclease HI family protein [Massilia sp.]